MGSKRKSCPECASHYVARSRIRGLFDPLLHTLTGLRPYRCTDCFHRFWRFPSSRSGGASSVAMHAARQSAPDLNEIAPLETGLRRLSTIPPPPS